LAALTVSAVRNHPGRVHHAVGLKELTEGVIGDGQREIAYKDIHGEFLGERGETMATSSLQYDTTIPRRSGGTTRHENVFLEGRNGGGAHVGIDGESFL
jgi:hypothetical protein